MSIHIGGGSPEGEEAARIGMNAAEQAATEHARYEVRRAIQWLAEHRPTFTSDDVWEAMEGDIEAYDAPEQAPDLKRQALGSIIRSFANGGIIERTGIVQSSRRSVRHNGTVAVWKSNVYGRLRLR